MNYCSSFVLFFVCLIALSSAQKSVDQAARDGGCTTSVVTALSAQLIEQINCLTPGTMKSFAGRSNIKYSNTVFPYLQGPVTDALVKAVDASGKTITLNSALRTLPQQYLLYRWNQLGLCGITAAAAPGRSNHNGGQAIDLSDYNTWKPLLSPYKFSWFGSSDAVHFTYTGTGTKDLNALSIKAFQILWNKNNPNDKIAEDGAYGPGTESRLQRAPVTGFAIGPDCAGPSSTGAPVTPPPETTTKCKANGVDGLCIDKDTCTGTSTAGLCPGAANIQCCTSSVIQPTDQCNTDKGVGVCKDVATCQFTAYSGFCPGANNIKCCVNVTKSSTTEQTTSQNALDLIKSFEGFYANFYIDPVGIKTIGYGHACHVSDCNNLQAKTPTGTFYKVTPPLTRQGADDLLRADLDNEGYEDCVRNKLTRTISDDQFGSLVSFAFNVGCGGLGGSTLLKLVNSNAKVEGTGGIREAFVKWNKAGGKVLAGLTRRRNAEADLYAGKVKSSSKRQTTELGVGNECWHYGEKGVCLNTAYCSGFRVAGLCPGSADVQCCLRNKCTVSAPNDGICTLDTDCVGVVSENITCKGATDLKCCLGTKPEPTTECPVGSTWSTTNRWCETSDSAYGPFTRYMVDQCLATGGGEVCEKRVEVTLSGQTVFVLKWEKNFALRLRGAGPCFAGSKAEVNFLGYCVEGINALAVNTTDRVVKEINVYGAISQHLQDVCQSFDGGVSCVTSRWSGDFFRSIAQPFHLSIVVTNDTTPVVDATGDDISDTSSNIWITQQSKLSAQHSTVSDVPLGETDSDIDSDEDSNVNFGYAITYSLGLLSIISLFFI